MRKTSNVVLMYSTKKVLFYIKRETVVEKKSIATDDEYKPERRKKCRIHKHNGK